MIAGFLLNLFFQFASFQDNLYPIFILIISTLYFPLTFLIISRQAGNIIGRLFLFVVFLFSIQVFGFSFVPFVESLPIPRLLIELAGNSWVPAFMTPMTVMLLLFPDGQLLSPRWRPIMVASILGMFLTYVSFTFESIWPEFASSDWAGIVTVIGLLSLLIGILGSTLSVVFRYKRSKGDVREQVKWLVYLAGLPIILMLLVLAAGFEDSPLIQIVIFSPPVFVAMAIGIAILRFRLYNIDLLFSRTLIYGSMSVIIAAIYILVVGFIGYFFLNESNVFSALIAAAIIAVLFQPLRNRLQKQINRMLFGQRDDPIGLLTYLAHRLESDNGRESNFPILVETIATALKLPYVAIWLPTNESNNNHQEKQWEMVVSFGKEIGETRIIPMLCRNQEIAQLHVSPRSPGEKFSEEDERLLATIAQVSASNVRTAQQTIELQRSRRMIVTSREEERRRLYRDLHDGLGSVLAAVALEADTARDLVDSDPKEAKTLLDSISHQTQTAVSDLRRLVHGFHPPALSELGLVTALKQSVRSYHNKLNIQIAADEIPPLPAAVEIAAYRIAQEAMSNVIKHAQAETCIITICHDEMLSLIIEDDGVGVKPNITPGVGLISMKERAAELGGACTINRRPSGGTRIEVVFPLPSDKED